MPATRPLEIRFVEKYHRSVDGCWLWLASKNRDGYGTFNRGLRRGGDLAHRVAWELANGPIPAGMEVCHRCDNPSCVRPDHLFLGSHGDNVRDCFAKGRANGHRYIGGERHKMAKLSVETVAQIRQAAGTHRALSEQFGVSASQIGRIKSGVRWREVR